MSPLITYALLLALILYALTVIAELFVHRGLKKFIVQLILLLALTITLNLTTGFPAARQAFGGASQLISIGIMFVFTVLGITAHSLFYLKGKFFWPTFLKPLLISPIVLLPLIGTVQASPTIEHAQLISFAFLAFQNGFFWKEVLEHARQKS